MQFTNKLKCTLFFFFFFFKAGEKYREEKRYYVLAEVMCIIKVNIYLFCIDRLSIICADFHYSGMIQ